MARTALSSDARLVRADQNAMVASATVPRSRFRTRHMVNTTFDAGKLIPFMCEEVLPGDQFDINVSAFVRMSTPLFPIFDSQSVQSFFFFVPNRLVWDNWARFMGERSPSELAQSRLVPQVRSPQGGFTTGSIADYFGLPVQGQPTATAEIRVNALPFRAYRLIYNEWFRDQNFLEPLAINYGDTEDFEDNMPQRRAKYHDMFTSALPWPQKRVNPVGVPMRGVAPVSGIGYPGGQTWSVGGSPTLYDSQGLVNSGFGFPVWTEPSRGTQYVEGRFSVADGIYVPRIVANLEAAGGIEVEDIRRAMQLQQFYERDARGGTRYVEKIRSHFGVINPDYRLQRPEYLGGGVSPLVVTPVAQTAPQGGTTVGALGAAASAAGSHRATYSATEHGFIIALINVQSELSYSQGVARMWTRRVETDYYFPDFAHLGEVGIKTSELYFRGTPADDVVFGFQERFYEYRQTVSMNTGLFRSAIPRTLDAWHLGQNFAGTPFLNQDFIEDRPPMARVLAAGNMAQDQQYLATLLIERNVTRPIPTYSTPASLGRF